MEDIKKDIGNKIYKIRKNKGLTQKMLASGICSQSVLSRIENNKEIPNIIVTAQLCKKLGITVDRLISIDYNQIQLIRIFFDEMNELLLKRKYKEMKQLIGEGKIVDSLYLDNDLQQFLYYQAFVKYCVDGEVDEAIYLLKSSLAYTFTENKKNNISLIEVQILDCLGKIYSDQGSIKLAERYQKLSYKLALSLPKESATFELARNYYHYAFYLYGAGHYEKSIMVASKGVEWVTEKMSLYYLENLFEIAKESYLKLDNQEKVIEMDIKMSFIKNLLCFNEMV